MRDDLRADINWMDREDIVQLLESHGYVCYESEPIEDLADALYDAVCDGDIDEDRIPRSFTRSDR